jgi:hypothetical protein
MLIKKSHLWIGIAEILPLSVSPEVWRDGNRRRQLLFVAKFRAKQRIYVISRALSECSLLSAKRAPS